MSEWALFIAVALFVGCPQFHALGLEGPGARYYLTKLLRFTIRVLVTRVSLFYPATNTVSAAVLRFTLPRKLTSPSVIQILCKIGHFSTPSHRALAVKRSERSVTGWGVYSLRRSYIEICFIWPGPLLTTDVELAHSSLCVVCVAPEIVPITRIYC